MNNTIPPLPPSSILNLQNDLPKTQANVIAEGQTIPVALGACQIGGKIFAVDYDIDTKTWTVGYVWCVGEIESITQVWLNGAAPDADVTQNDYLGTTSQTADPLLAAAISGYSDTLVLTRPGGDIGIAYTVIQYTDSVYKSFPNAIAEVEGLQTNGGSFSESPARAIGHLIEHDVLGVSGTVDATSLGTVITDNAATVVSEARREIGLLIDNPLPFWQWISILAGYASCWITKRGSTFYFVSDRPRSQDAALTGDDWFPKSFGIRGPGKSSVPTVVEVIYTDKTEVIWRSQVAVSEDAGVAGGTVPRRVSRVSMPGVTRYSQAIREATERRLKLSLMQPSIEFRAFDDQLVREIGDVIDITRGSHITNVDYRVIEPPVKTLGNGILVRASKYDSSVYSDLEPADPTFGTTPDFIQGGGVQSDGSLLYYREDFEGKTISEILADWSIESDIGGEESIVTDTASPIGNAVWQMGNASGDDEVARALTLQKKIPIVENRLYRIIFAVSRESGSVNDFHGGVAGIAADGETYVNVSGADALGSQHHFAADGVLQTIDGVYEIYTGYFIKNGDSATDRAGVCPIEQPGVLHEDAHFVVPYFLANNNNAVGQHRIAYIELSSVEQTGVAMGVNLMPSGLDTFGTDYADSFLTDKMTYINGAGNLTLSSTQSVVDGQAVRVEFDGTQDSIFFAAATTSYPMSVTPEAKYIISMKIFLSVIPDTYFRMRIRQSNGLYKTYVHELDGVTTNAWHRIWSEPLTIDAAIDFASLLIQISHAGTFICYFDEVMVEEYKGNEINPRPSNFSRSVDSGLYGAETGADGSLKDEDGNPIPDLNLKNETVATDDLAGNLIRNSFMKIVDPVYDRPLGPKATYSSSVEEDIGYADVARTILSSNSPGGDISIGMCWPAFQVNRLTKYRVAIRWRMTSGTINNGGLYFRMFTKNSAIDQGATHIGSQGQGEAGVDTAGAGGASTLTVLSDDNGASGTHQDEDVTALNTWFFTILEYDPRDTSHEWASFGILNWSGLGDAQLEIDSLVMFEQPSYGAQLGVNFLDESGNSMDDGDILNEDINTHLRALPSTGSFWITNDGANYDPAISEGGTDTQDITVEAINNGVIASVVWRWTAQNTASSNSDTIQSGAFSGSSTGWSASTPSGTGTASASVVITHTASGETITLTAGIVNTSISGGGK